VSGGLTNLVSFLVLRFLKLGSISTDVCEDTFTWFWRALASQASSNSENLNKDQISTIFDSIDYEVPKKLAEKVSPEDY
jgi:hypothetical protein